jgi:divalent metal cation (Fe/Co/Zn/Cd) transporter
VDLFRTVAATAVAYLAAVCLGSWGYLDPIIAPLIEWYLR